MKGIINKGIQDLVESKFGSETWDKVKEVAGCNEPFFAAGKDYPDELTVSLVEVVSETTGLSIEDVMVEFGKFWVPNTGCKSYPSYFQIAGTSSREFLMNMDKVHTLVTRSLPNAAPPRFEYEELEDGRLLMHYKSSRRLCPVLRGLILGVGIHHDEELQVEEIACSLRGDPHCIMEVTFP